MEEKKVTREWMVRFVETQPRDKVELMVGRALVALFKRQTDDEKSSGQTTHINGAGFSSNDAHSGSLTAKSYMKHKKLADWQLDKWTKPNIKGIPRIARYHRQLNEIAIEREEAVIAALKGIV